MKTRVLLILAAFCAAGILRADTLVLKDGQVAEGTIGKFDDYFVEFTTESGVTRNVPWREVRSIQETELSGASAFFGEKLDNQHVKVETVLVPLDPARVRAKAFWPGIVVHGWGHREARQRDRFLSALGMELFGLTIAAIGASDFLQPGADADDTTLSSALLITGASAFLLSWVYDIVFSPQAARKYNKENGFALAPLKNGLMLGLKLEY